MLTGLSGTGVLNICKRHQEIGAKVLRDAPGGARAVRAERWSALAGGAGKWLEHDYPAIAARTKAEGAEIHWGHKSGLRVCVPMMPFSDSKKMLDPVAPMRPPGSEADPRFTK